ncbi:MAG: 3-demethylubiquinone-9 3-methyltransferase [uncultured bacterium]|uniref:PhnB-like domain-containing protein n=1 Tax=Candidatus Wolfebacteria bacterium GW2011_GWE2_44_13 TaxID=1619017 RepID=A0A0G1H997_9BACT|nr:MAG: 3-demethylubiquinone-9 3-methyltransferase [uncultured bacterium]KKT43951.1 MAG: hypothetical protein UW32_C0001G0543 [Candidatus Wolfebacteria bacterium GW2011_GWE2_44_13]
MQKIVPCLWFDDKAEEAVNFYLSIFKEGKILNIDRYGAEGAQVSGKPEGSISTVEFELNGQRFLCLNGGPMFKLTPAISFAIYCKTQEEVDHYWEKLIEGGDEKAQQCGWLQDKYGVTWQVVPEILDEMLRDKDPKKAERVMHAMLPMIKIDIEALKKAYEEA